MGTQDEKREKDNFIMLPTVDFCFKELMQNPKVRKGFIAAILGKAPKEVRRTTLVPTALRKESEDGIIRWMRFLGGKSRKEFEDMARKDEYIEEAYNELKKLSLDEQKRLEYELRQKAVRDHNMRMKSAEKRGLEIGKRQGEQLALKRIIERQLENGKTEKETADLLGMDIQEVRELAGK